MTVGAAWLSVLLCVAVASSGCARRSTLPESLSDADFWALIETLSEPPGTFDVSENLLSNEPDFVDNARRLRGAGGVYVGVGPEQNFSYIARLRPAMAVIVDIRRENQNLHLLYKALFELSADRAEFVSLLFSRPRPANLGSGTSVDEIFERYEKVPATTARRIETSTLIRERLVTAHHFGVAQSDLEFIDRALQAFAADGPAIHFWGARAVDDNAIRPWYRQLMTARDVSGHAAASWRPRRPSPSSRRCTRRTGSFPSSATSPARARCAGWGITYARTAT